MLKHEIYKPETFLYFAYTGNLLTFRLHMHSPSAEFVSIARLDNYRLDFIKYSHFWGGPTGTLVPTANAHVWGVIWRLHTDDLVSLDETTGVGIKKYYVKYVTVLTPYMGMFTCRAYKQRVIPLPRGDNDEIPVERWPSWTYKEVMILGATEHEIPQYYIDMLREIKHNGEEGWLRAVCLLIRYGRDKPCECRVPGRIPRKPLKIDLRKRKAEEDSKLKLAKSDISKEDNKLNLAKSYISKEEELKVAKSDILKEDIKLKLAQSDISKEENNKLKLAKSDISKEDT